MASKLTISINEEIREAAKKYAETTGRSLSEIIEEYLRFITTNPSRERKISPEIRRLKGSVPLPEDFDYEEARTQSLMDKHVK